MIEIQRKSDCCGCGACANICPRVCISMEPDSEGFLYPKVNLQNCVNCHLCEHICPVINAQKEDATAAKDGPIVLSAKAMDDEIREKSSSGGIFSLLAAKVLESGGCVFGAAFDENFNVCHIEIRKFEDIPLLRTSKYVQSDTKATFQETKASLDAGKKVFYVGTPCQIEGLQKYLSRTNTDKLFTADFVCHGVPSPKVWEKYKASQEESVNDRISDVSFRDKYYGWKTFSLCIRFKSKTRYRRILTFDKYLQTFLRNISLRPSCYECRFKKVNRVSDITLGDFWGIRKIRKSFDDDKGVSLVMIHSEKGLKAIESIKECIAFNHESLKSVLKINTNAVSSVKMPISRASFFKNLNLMAFDTLYNKFVKYSLLKEMKNTVKGFAKILLRCGGLKF